ncbi:MAG: hybrid sensor histidine kinase/response regulator [Anaerolineae bacterium]|nr:hybrid sensor histidine kinase/response regulator [Anaerolineae bacterium]
MSLSASIREQIISSFRAELKEHIQTLTDGLLALEQRTVSGDERQELLENVFRAAHSLKGAARAVGVTAVEQLAHALESVLSDMQNDAIALNAGLFTACYQALDAIQTVQAAYEAGETTPPLEALQALTAMQAARAASAVHAAAPSTPPAPEEADTPETPPKPAPIDRRLDAAWAGVDARTVPPTPPADAGDAPAALEAAFTNGQASQPAQKNAAGRQQNDETIRVSVGKLDALMAQLSELLVTKIRAEQRLDQMHQVQEALAEWQRDWLTVRSTYGKMVRQSVGRTPWKGDVLRVSQRGNGKLGKETFHLLRYVGASQERMRDLNALVNDLSRQYANDTINMSLVIDELEEEIKRVRMLPLSTITGSFGRMVRDLAQAAGKEARLEIVGGETELDKRVLEQIKDPLIHLLRNAVDHGLELPAHRIARGKPACGTITLSAENLGNDVLICISDDGAGLNEASIRQVVARRRGIDPETLSEADLREAIFSVGVSTSPIVTDISGRGVGLDVVRRNVEALHGRINVEWRANQGSAFTLILPLRLTSSRGLFVTVSHQRFAIPLNNVEYIMHVGPSEIASLEGYDTVRYKGQPITLVRLNDVLGLPRVQMQDYAARIPVVILAAAERHMAFAVDELAGEQEVVIKDLGKQLSRVGGVAGATVMGTGEVVLILNVADLIKLALGGERRSVFDAQTVATSPAKKRAQQRILIVDDSITTRTLEKNILEAVGYSIQVATDGQEALDAIATYGVPDLIVSDIAMPRINGFELTERVKNDPKMSHVPVILVTSLESLEDKAHGIECGADAYITKGSFDQNNLLETIEQLI